MILCCSTRCCCGAKYKTKESKKDLFLSGMVFDEKMYATESIVKFQAMYNAESLDLICVW